MTSYDVVYAITYYTPYVSGLTETVHLVARELAARGRSVGVCAVRHDPRTPLIECREGVAVHRSRAIARLSKGLVSPTFAVDVLRASRHAGVVHLHLPMADAGLVARILPRTTRLVTTYHCDVNLSAGVLDRAIIRALDWSSAAAIRRSERVVVSSLDYAEHSRLSAELRRRPLDVITPPTVFRGGGRPAYRAGTGPHFGFLGRIVEEKGIELLVEAFRRLPDPEARLLIGGDFDRVAGGSVIERVRRAIGQDARIRVLGFVPEERLPDFYASLDTLVLPSVNSLEAFGIVQVEAMMCGVPVIASDIPGVRQPVLQTGFGDLVPPRDAGALASRLRAFSPSRFSRPEGSARARALYSLAGVVDAHQRLYADVTGDR